jgi:DMSO/TMAO reductase YedYZ heme-binding membrane subunit
MAAPSSPSGPRSPDLAGASRRSLLEGWPLTLTASAVIAATTAAVLAVGELHEAAIQAALRVTARASFALFLAAFTASAAHRLWPARVTGWQRRNRRYLGVAFAASHGIHAVMIALLAALQPLAFHDHTRHTNPIPGTIAYGFIIAMALTSFDRTAAWLGRRAWNALHTVGAYYVWAIFLISFASRADRVSGYAIPAVLAIGAVAIRVAARRRAGDPSRRWATRTDRPRGVQR